MPCVIFNQRTEEVVGGFVHIPRTGGTFTRYVLPDFGLGSRMTGLSHGGAPQFPDELSKTAFCFTLARHPVTWYLSYYSYWSEREWDTSYCSGFPHSIELQSPTFAGFVDNVERLFGSDHLGKAVKSMLGGPWHVRVYPYEKFAASLGDAIGKMAGVGRRYVEERVRWMARVNRSHPKERVSSETADRIVSMEQNYVYRYYSGGGVENV